MRYIADLHIHSHYSRSTGREMTLEGLHYWAQIKGVRVLGTGDFTHPAWFGELMEKLEPAEPGFFKLRDRIAGPLDQKVPESCRGAVRFVLSAEISCIYSRAGKTRKVHNLVFCPDMATSGAINTELMKIGNLHSDGRPILGLDSEELIKIALGANPEAVFVPAHAWTPHFSVFGAFSSFSSLEECYGDWAKEIFAIETGLSSDPIMNRRLSALDSIALISNSDAHSPAKLLREGNVFDTDLSYKSMFGAVKRRDRSEFLETIEFFPEEGKYHYDGHRNCGVRLHPSETVKNQGLCPKCGRKITVGVLSRVEELADRSECEIPDGFIPFQSLVPLAEIISETLKTGPQSKGVQRVYMELVSALGPEYEILMSAPLEAVAKTVPGPLAGAIANMRDRKVKVEAGYDGEYGRISLLAAEDKKSSEPQLSLF